MVCNSLGLPVEFKVYQLFNTAASDELGWDKVALMSQEYMQKIENMFHSASSNTNNKKKLMEERPRTSRVLTAAGATTSNLGSTEPPSGILQLLMQGGRKAFIKDTVVSPSGLWMLPVIDIIDGPVLFINHEDKHLDSEVYFEPYASRLPEGHQILTRPMSALKKRIMTYTVTGRSLGSLTSTNMNEGDVSAKLDMQVVVFQVTMSDGKFEFQLVTFGSHQHELQRTLLDYLAYTVKKKEENKEEEAKAQMKILERVEQLKQQEKQKELKNAVLKSIQQKFLDEDVAGQDKDELNFLDDDFDTLLDIADVPGGPRSPSPVPPSVTGKLHSN
jgi:hypothetical protein